MTGEPSTARVGTLAPVRHPGERLLLAVEERLTQFLRTEWVRWSTVDPRAAVPIQALADLVQAGGKRIRPAFCISGFLAAGGDPEDESIVPAAVALELLHACALIHDDVMDASEWRRGAATVHAKHASVHRERGWRGEPRRFGEGVAILAGDLALTYSDQLMALSPVNPGPLWHELRTELLVGQFLDIATAADGDVDERLCRWIAVVKSGRYTIERPLLIGATIAGRPELAAVFEEYGVALGEAFQLRDDLIDAFGAGPDATGKPTGLDFEQHKMTLLMALAMQRDEQVREANALDVVDPARLRTLMIQTGARAEVEARIDLLVERSRQVLERAPLDPLWRDELTSMAYQVAYRDR